MGTFANSEEPDSMLQHTPFNQGLYCLLRQNRSSEKKIQYYMEIINCHPSKYIIYHPGLNCIKLNGKFHLVLRGLSKIWALSQKSLILLHTSNKSV